MFEKWYFYKKTAEIFGQFEKSSYLCSRFQEIAREIRLRLSKKQAFCIRLALILHPQKITSRSGAVGSSPGS